MLRRLKEELKHYYLLRGWGGFGWGGPWVPGSLVLGFGWCGGWAAMEFWTQAPDIEFDPLLPPWPSECLPRASKNDLKKTTPNVSVPSHSFTGP